MASKTVKVRNDAGIHCRPSSMILLAAQSFSNCKIRIKTQKGDSDLKSILSLISLGLEKGEDVTVEADGEDAERVCGRIAELFANDFDFPSMEREQENADVFV